MLKFENKALLANERLRTLKQILPQSISYFKIDSAKQVMIKTCTKTCNE